MTVPRPDWPCPGASRRRHGSLLLTGGAAPAPRILAAVPHGLRRRVADRCVRGIGRKLEQQTPGLPVVFSFAGLAAARAPARAGRRRRRLRVRRPAVDELRAGARPGGGRRRRSSPGIGSSSSCRRRIRRGSAACPDLTRRGNEDGARGRGGAGGCYSREALHNLAKPRRGSRRNYDTRVLEQRRVPGGQRESGGCQGAARRGRCRNRLSLGRHAGRRRYVRSFDIPTSTTCWPAIRSPW